MAKSQTRFFRQFKDKVFIPEKSTTVNLISAVLGLIITNGNIFSSLSPFGIALAAALSLDSKSSIIPIAAIFMGYIAKGTAGIKYALATAGIYSLRLLFKKNGYSYNNNSFFAISAGVLLFVTGLGEMLSKGISPYESLVSLSLCVLCGGIAYFYIKSFPILSGFMGNQVSLTRYELVGIIICLSTLLLSLSWITVFEMSLGVIIGAFVLLIAARNGGLAFASMAGVAVGAVISLSGIGGDITMSGGLYSASVIGIYAFSGLITGIFSESKKITCAGAFLLSNSLLMVYMNNSSEILIRLSELMLGCLIFIIVPEKTERYLANLLLFKENDEKQTPYKFKELFIERLRFASNSFSQLAEAIKSVGEAKPADTKKDMQTIVGEVTQSICKGCKGCMFCWGSAFNDTMGVFNDTISTYAQKGLVEVGDLPSYFEKRCGNSKSLIADLNVRLTSYYSKETVQLKKEENRVILAQQYSGVSEIMNNMASELESAVKFDTLSSDRISSYLAKEGIRGSKVSAYSDADGLNVIEIHGGKVTCDLPKSKKLCNDISMLSGCDMMISYMHCDGLNLEIKLCEKEEFSVSCAKAACQKDGQTVCGDFASSFRAGGGKYIITLSDGMGSGKQAERDSLLTVAFLEKLLKAGFDKESALKLVNSALILKSDSKSFATVDISVINLITGAAEFIKAGAAPTFIKRDKNVYELGCSSLPAGIFYDTKFEKSKCKLKDKDFIVMVSDGITAPGTKLITKIISEYGGDSPAELTRIILDESIRICGKTDDMTVVSGYINQNL